MLKVINISKNFGKRDILKNITIDINSKSIVAITGKSGTGKSTLLGIISGLMKPDEGKVYFQDKNIFRWGDFRRSRFRNRKIGFVFQFFSLFPELTAYENILYPAILNPFTSKKIYREINDLVDLLKINKIVDQYPSTLSGGERQRVAIARAIINNPKLILADEPTGNLDEATTNDIIDLFIRLKNQKDITIIIATHEKKLIKISDVEYSLNGGGLKKIETVKKKKNIKANTNKRKSDKQKSSAKPVNKGSKKKK